MEDEFYFEESNPKRVKIIIAVLLVIFACACVLFIMARNKYTLSVRKVVEYEVGDKLSYNIKDYLYNNVIDESDYKLTFSSFISKSEVLDTVGEYDYKVTFQGISKKGKIKVVDTKAPVVEIDRLIIGVDEELVLSDAISKCEDFSLPCQVDFVKESDADITKKAGVYEVPITISDHYGNKTKKTITVEVKENYNSISIKENDLNASYIDQEYMEWNNEFLVKFSKAYKDDHLDEIDEYDLILEATEGDMHRYLDPIYANNRIDKLEMVSIYNKYNYIIGITYYLELDNGKSFYIKSSTQ